jgi:hypothetical protein
MIERTYQYSHTLTLELRDWCLLNNIEVDIFHTPPSEINSANGRTYYYQGRTNIKFITRSESTDLMLRLKAGQDIQLIEEMVTFES